MTHRLDFANVLFSDSARQMFALAREHALRLGHERVGSEHVLLGLLGMSGGAAGRAMDSIGVDRRSVRARIEVLCPAGDAPRDRRELPYAENGVKLLQNAMEEARRLQPSRVTTAHLLIASVGDKNDVAYQALESAGVAPGDLLSEARRSPDEGET